MNRDAVRLCYEIIQVHSKSFALASKLLPSGVRDRAAVVYAWCRRADDAVDLAHDTGRHDALSRLRAELRDIYSGHEMDDPVLAAFQRTVHDCRIHQAYAEDLLDGMAMDVDDTYYDTMETLLRYCYRVAGTVGLMMCHVMGVRNEAATRNAVHLGIAMQLTNICRDVQEDWERGRLYIPNDLLAATGCESLRTRLGRPIADADRPAIAVATECLLDEADRYYNSGDAGLCALSWRCALSVRTARRVYAAIGTRVRRAGGDPLAGRAVVPTSRKLAHVAASLAAACAELPRRAMSPVRVAIPRRRIVFPTDVLPV